MTKDLNRGATEFLRAQFAAYAARRLRGIKLSGGLRQRLSAAAEAQGSSLGELSSLDNVNSGRCEAAIRPAASALLCGEGE